MTEARLTRLELALEHTAKDADLRELRARFDAAVPTLATKTDLANLKITALVAIGVATVSIVGALAGATWTVVEKFWPLIEKVIVVN